MNAPLCPFHAEACGRRFKPNDRDAGRMVQADVPGHGSWGFLGRPDGTGDLYRFDGAAWNFIGSARVGRHRIGPLVRGVPWDAVDALERALGRPTPSLPAAGDLAKTTPTALRAMLDAVSARRAISWPDFAALDALGAPFLWPSVEDELILRDLVRRGALVVVNLSGGKDSQAMLVLLARIVPRAQLLAVHAHLPEVSWAGTQEAARAHAEAAGATYFEVQAGQTFFEMVEARASSREDKGKGGPPWPSAKFRLCTDRLKVAPIEKALKAYSERHGFPLIVSAAGVRAEESPRRAKQLPWSLNDETLDPFRPVKRGPDRVWLNYLPIHHLLVDEVMAVIHAAGQTVHPAYYPDAEGGQNERFSCILCIMASPNDLRMGALKNPEHYADYVAKEAKYGYAMHQSMTPLVELTGLTPEQAYAQRRHLPVVTGPLERVARPEGKSKGKSTATCVDEWAAWGGD